MEAETNRQDDWRKKKKKASQTVTDSQTEEAHNDSLLRRISDIYMTLNHFISIISIIVEYY